MMSPGTLTALEMEAADGRLRRSGLLNSVDAIHVLVSAYVVHRKCYRLVEFVRGAAATPAACCYCQDFFYSSLDAQPVFCYIISCLLGLCMHTDHGTHSWSML